MRLEEVRAAVLLENNYEALEFWYPYYRLIEAGAKVLIISPIEGETYQSKHGYPAKSDLGIDKVAGQVIDIVVIPGGWAPDKLRQNENILKFVKTLFEQGKIIAAICHGPSVLVSASILNGKKLTCVKAIKD